MIATNTWQLSDGQDVFTFHGINDGIVPGYIVRNSHNSSPHHHTCTICVKQVFKLQVINIKLVTP